MSSPPWSRSNNAMKGKWTFQTDVPTERFDVPIAISSKEFIITPYHNRHSQNNGLYKYNTDRKTWTEWIAFSNTFRTSFHTSALDEDNNLLYIYNKEALLVIMNLETKQCKVHKVRSYGKYASSVVINGSFHLIGGFKSNKHLIWNNRTSEFEDNYHFKEFGQGYYLHKICYIRTKQLLYLMGGYYSTSRSQRATDSIYCYHVATNHWDKLYITLPRRMYSFGCIITRNENYILLFGGNDTNHIHLFDVNKPSIKKLNVLCPTNGGFKAVILNKYQLDRITVVAFIREYFKLAHFENLQFPPTDCIDLIHKFYNTEYIHLIQPYKKQHWKIKLNDLLDYYKPK